MNPKESVLTAVVATGLVITADIALTKTPFTFSRYISLTFLAVMLVILAGVVPDVAAAFAWLMFIAVLLAKGTGIFKALKFA
jgi:hypothetical protein